MRDRAEQRRLDEVAASQRLRLERLALEARAVERDAEERRERRQEPAADDGVRLRVDRRVDRADDAAVDLERRRHVRVSAVLLPELDLRALDTEHLGGATADPVELVLERPAAEQVSRDLGEQRRLALALLGVGRAAARAGRELAARRPR